MGSRLRSSVAWRAVVIVLGIVLLVLAGGVLASNFGFKVHYPLRAADGVNSFSGTNYIGLPFLPKLGLVTAKDLFMDIGPVIKIERLSGDGSFEQYTFGGGDLPPNGWDLVPGEAYIVKVSSDVNYRILGSHDPSLSIQLSAKNPSFSTANYVAVPYHTTASTARELFQEIGGTIQSIEKHRRADDQFDIYTFGGGSTPPDGWNLEPGEGYIISVLEDQLWMPSHY